jgi:cysteine desulfurase
MMYFDHAATTPTHAQVVEAMMPYFTTAFGNASSLHRYGRQARVAIEDARIEIAEAMGAHPAELLFTSGGTESNNTIVKSLWNQRRISSIAVSSIEHHAMLDSAHHVEQFGCVVHKLPVTNSGFVEVSAVAPFNHDNTLLCIMHANNEVGSIQPIKQIRERAPNALLAVDCVQSFGKITVNMQEMGADFATISAHKIHGPKGVGALFVRKGIDFAAHQVGGSQERNRRAGTEAVALIVGFQHAVRLAMQQQRQVLEHLQSLQTVCIELLKVHVPCCTINTHGEHSLPSIVNCSFDAAVGIEGEALLQMLDMEGLAVSSGSACVSGSQQPSHVLLAMGKPEHEARCGVRFSFSAFTTHQELEQAITIFAQCVRTMRA